jgi:hypothetical protein
LLTWNPVLGLSLLFAAPVFDDAGSERGVWRGLFLTGGLCVAGTIGSSVGNMRLQLVGIVGYAVVLPIVCAMLTRQFGRPPIPRS